MASELKEYFRVIRKRIWLIGLLVAFCLAVTAVVSYFLIRPVYSASTKIIVNKSVQSPSGVPVLDNNTVMMNIRLVNTYKEIIKTTGIMDKVAAAYPEFGLTGEQLIGKVRVSSVNDTQVMTLTVEDESYDRAVRIVNAITEVFQAEIPAIMQVDNVTILSRAKPSEHPVPIKPKPLLNMLISLVVSSMAAVGLAFLLEYLDDTIRSEKDVEELLGLPVLATIWRVKPDDRRARAPNEQTNTRQVGETYASVNR